jgi:hypothetical protein
VSQSEQSSSQPKIRGNAGRPKTRGAH